MSNIDITPWGNSKNFMGIEILDQKSLHYDNIDGVKFCEISDLAYNRKSHKLYMVSDEGRIFEFKAIFNDKISKLTPIKAVNISKKNGKKFRNYRRDSEGATLDYKGRLVLSFEGRPKVARFGSDGRMLYKYHIPKAISKIRYLRGKNKGIEALAYHYKYGFLMATEYPIKKNPKSIQSIYSSKGKKWHFSASSYKHSAITAIEVMSDGNILVLERAFNGLFNPFIITLKKVYINNSKNSFCRSEVLATMDNSKGWDIDNFEGLTRVGKDRYIMISDDGDNFYQNTLLIYFKIK
ncbi:lipoprotein [hydrothermal vent metagenome]|uniref:Lipoprotein n=1 Tax=hydrothermal vent metagenome TaxID=652676 RepID=A0A1W1EJN6_9ZZZZ